MMDPGHTVDRIEPFRPGSDTQTTPKPPSSSMIHPFAPAIFQSTASDHSLDGIPRQDDTPNIHSRTSPRAQSQNQTISTEESNLRRVISQQGPNESNLIQTESSTNNEVPGPSPKLMQVDVTARGRGPGRPRGSRGKMVTSKAPTRGHTRGTSSRGRGGKRKRSHRGHGGDDADGDSSSTDSSIEITSAATRTKSGRSVTKPIAYVPAPVQTSPSSNRSMLGASNGDTLPKKKRTYRRNPESAVCKICLRGVSPTTNMIVFCDGCNAPYHRYCHRPTIDQSVVDQVSKEWFCLTCVRQNMPHSTANAAATRDFVDVGQFVAIENIDEDERSAYVASLSENVLAALLIKAARLHPDLPMYPSDYKASLLRSSTEAASHSIAEMQVDDASLSTVATQDAQLLFPERVPEGHPERYPCPGHGLMNSVPSERQDDSHLVDLEDEYGVFSHIYQSDPQSAQDALHGMN